MTPFFKSATAALSAAALIAATATAMAQHMEPSGRVVGGTNALPGAWPYQAALNMSYQGRYGICGGTLVASKWVLTAAHCVCDTKGQDKYEGNCDGGLMPKDAFTVRVNSVARSSGGQVRRVAAIITHENYGRGHLFSNDIALLELDQPVNGVAPILVDGLNDSANGRGFMAFSASENFAKVLGWGYLAGRPHKASWPDNRPIPEHLQEAAIPIVTNATCEAALSNDLRKVFGGIDASRICAGRSQGGVDSCNGDSGGPLLRAVPGGGWAQVGIVSFGDPDCGKAGTYGVYTATRHYARWIAQKTGLTPAAAPIRPSESLFDQAPALLQAAADPNSPVQVQVLRRAKGGSKALNQPLTEGDDFTVRVTSGVAGYLLLIDLSPDGTLNRVYPNDSSAAASRIRKIEPNAPITVPDGDLSKGFAFEASEPYGRGRIFAIVASDPAAIEKILAAPEPKRDAMARDLIVTLKNPGQPSAPRNWWAGQVDYIVNAKN